MTILTALERAKQVAPPKPWPAIPLYLLGFANFGLSALHSTCLCREGSMLGQASALLAFVFLVRLVLARVRKETGSGWVVWAALFGTSAGWLLVADAVLH
jgi:hypothetical protein